MTRREGYSPMQRHLLRLVAAGKQNKEIAKELGVCRKTIEARVTHLLVKSHARNRVQLVANFLTAEDPRDYL